MKRIAALVLAIAALSGCGGHARTTHGSAQSALTAMQQLARCIRAHGLPGFPDPTTRSDGTPTEPDSAPRVPEAAQRACSAVAARIPPDYTETRPVSSGDLDKLLRLARCIRARGIPDWPDPNALGEFPIDAKIQQGGKQLFAPVAHACARFNPDPSGGIHVVRAP